MDTTVETGESRIVKEYNIETRKWESSADVKRSKNPSAIEDEPSEQRETQ